MPSDEDVRRDYGFSRAQLPLSENWLCGIFQGIFRHSETDSRTIHQHRLAGTLIEFIKEYYERIPVGARGSYYPWFLENQHLLAPSRYIDSSSISLTDDSFQHTWWFTGGSITEPVTRIKAHYASWPNDKQQCFRFSQFILHAGFQLSPDRPEWLRFGFCGYKLRTDEQKLWAAYVKLVKATTFEEFYAAYCASTLPALFATHGMRLSNPFVLDVLGSGPRQLKSVWKLKQFVTGDYQKPSPEVSIDYGFVKCGNTIEKESVIHSLRLIYAKFFEVENSDPLKLHEACLQNRLFEYVQQVTGVDAKFAPLMRNVYAPKDA